MVRMVPMAPLQAMYLSPFMKKTPTCSCHWNTALMEERVELAANMVSLAMVELVGMAETDTFGKFW